MLEQEKSTKKLVLLDAKETGDAYLVACFDVKTQANRLMDKTLQIVGCKACNKGTL